MTELRFSRKANPYQINVKDELGVMVKHAEDARAAEDAMSDEEWAHRYSDWWAEDHARDFNAAQRRKAAKEGASLPDGSFPIYNQEDATNAAILASKSKKPLGTVLAHIRKRVKALGLKMPPSAAGASA